MRGWDILGWVTAGVVIILILIAVGAGTAWFIEEAFGDVI